tara:strand:+ start:1153 stop:1617 length:465 start_codon:yes stop_codon:yes gene_type:complete
MFLLNSQKILKEWTDYNQHMNLSYYILVFDNAAEVMLSKFQMGEQAAKNTNRSTMAVESHTFYKNEVKEGEEVDVFLTHVDHDKKRIHYRLEMYEKVKKTLSASTEVLSLYMDLGQRKVREFEPEKIDIMDDFIYKNKTNFKSEKLIFSDKLKK